MQVPRIAQHVVPGHSMHPFDSGTQILEAGDAVLFVDVLVDVALRQVVPQKPQTFLALPKCRFGLLVIGDVVHHHLNGRSQLIGKACRNDFHVPFTAVQLHHPGFGQRHAAALQNDFYPVCHGVMEFLMEKFIG